MSTGINYLMNFVIGEITPVMLENIAYGTYMFFFATNAVCFIIIYLFYPGKTFTTALRSPKPVGRAYKYSRTETKGKTLEEMEILFGGEEADVIKQVVERKYAGRTDIEVGEKTEA